MSALDDFGALAMAVGVRMASLAMARTAREGPAKIATAEQELSQSLREYAAALAALKQSHATEVK